MISLWAGVAATVIAFGVGAWRRRWMADDGLIVLRTVRNLMAGNGPVFNAGERVEANTSTVWSYLMYVACNIAGPMRMEYVAVAMALFFSVAGIALLMVGAARLYAPAFPDGRVLLAPAGALAYIALPPARDFATSGLENGLILAYLGLLWLLLITWSQPPSAGPGLLGILGINIPGDHADRRRRRLTGWLAFVAGLSVLVRPELALIGIGVLLAQLLTGRTRAERLRVVVAGGVLPVGYQIFRMGYYGLLVPGTAVAKDAAGDKWTSGVVYLQNFVAPYALAIPALLALALGAVLALAVTRRIPYPAQRRGVTVTRVVQTPAAVVCFFVLSGVLQALYWTRQGGDFMHARVLLAPILCMLAPLAVIPLPLPDQAARRAGQSGTLVAGTVGMLWVALAGWSLWAANVPGMHRDAARVTYHGIVDERRYYALATGNAHPLTAADFLNFPRMRAILTTIAETPQGALLLPAGNYDEWNVIPPLPRASGEPDRLTAGHTVFFTNMGMASMNTGLDVRVIDQIGLVNPLATHSPRIDHGRIGHDKDLLPEWVIADGPWAKRHPDVLSYLDEDRIAQAQAALRCPATEAVLNSVRASMGPRQFLSNFWHSAEFTRYRIERLPRDELIRCGLDVPAAPGNHAGQPLTEP